jgi:myo-inositol-1(or 4)-monophosphatase
VSKIYRTGKKLSQTSDRPGPKAPAAKDKNKTVPEQRLLDQSKASLLPSVEWTRVQNAAREAALLARESSLSHLGRLKKVSEKFQAGLVSEADQEAELLIKGHLLKCFPEFDFLGEEETYARPEKLQEAKKAEGVWIVDPIDGTTNYVHGFHVFCISIGLLYRGELSLAVIDVPVLNETYTALRGQGAFLNGQPMKVSSTPSLRQSLVSTGFYGENESLIREQLAVFSHLVRQVRGVRRTGAAAYDLCMVARGIFDGFWERNLKPWDTAAGALLVREAGGLVKTFKGKDYQVFNNSLVASNSQIMPEFLEAFARENLPHVD